jgi:molecular chaperone HtpG
VKHSNLEGIINLTLLLFVPKRSRFNMFEKGNKKDNVKLYVKNVFVTDDLKDAVPDWMTFISGVISSDDIPMNVNREMIQGNNTMKAIAKNLSKKALELLNDIAKDEAKYDTFYKEFSSNVKMAVRENTQDDQQMAYARLLRYYSTMSGEKMTNLDEYVSRMKEGQKQIYVLTGMSKDEVMKSPFLESFRGYEVLFMYEPVDEIMLQGFRKYSNLDIQRITSEGVDLPGKKEMSEEFVKSYEGFLAAMKDTLSISVEKVVLSKGLETNPCVISTPMYSYSAAMENIIRSQPGADNNPFLQMMGRSKKIFEINPNHRIIINMKKLFDENKSEELRRHTELLFTTALIECGYKIDDCVKFANSVFSFMGDSAGNEVIENVNDEVL